MTTPTRPEFQTDLFRKGLKIREEVVGKSYVARSLANADDFTAPLQKLVTEWCWGEVWSREGLDRRTRSFLNLAMLAALNRPHELKLHAHGALNNGVTPEEMREVVLQAAIYCGVPAALDSMRVIVDAINTWVPENAGAPEGSRT